MGEGRGNITSDGRCVTAVNSRIGQCALRRRQMSNIMAAVIECQYASVHCDMEAALLDGGDSWNVKGAIMESLVFTGDVVSQSTVRISWTV